MALGKDCRWDWVAEIGAVIDGAASFELDTCDRPPAHTVILKREIYDGGLTVHMDVEVCDVHELEAQGAGGYVRSLKARTPSTT